MVRDWISSLSTIDDQCPAGCTDQPLLECKCRFYVFVRNTNCICPKRNMYLFKTEFSLSAMTSGAEISCGRNVNAAAQQQEASWRNPNLFVQIAICICPNCNMYFFKLNYVFVQVHCDQWGCAEIRNVNAAARLIAAASWRNPPTTPLASRSLHHLSLQWGGLLLMQHFLNLVNCISLIWSTVFSQQSLHHLLF